MSRNAVAHQCPRPELYSSILCLTPPTPYDPALRDGVGCRLSKGAREGI